MAEGSALSSPRRRPGSRDSARSRDQPAWIPAFAGMTEWSDAFYEPFQGSFRKSRSTTPKSSVKSVSV